MMAKGTYASINLATADLDDTFDRLLAGDAEVVQEPTDQPYGIRDCAFRDPAGKPDSHPGAALSRPAIAPEVNRVEFIRQTEVLRNG
jgi:Glyoxalase/Bleomycin resistance protein/Dioxygenase superfamily